MKFLLRLLRKLRLLTYINLWGSYPLDKSIKIPVIKSLGYDHFFEKEPWLVDLLNGLISPSLHNDCFIDVGVNIGQTLLKVRSVNKSIEYVGFEPNPNCLFYIYELMKCNAFEKITIFPYALSTKSEVLDLEFYSPEATDPYASIVPGMRNHSEHKIKVPVLNGSEFSYFNKLRTGVIKIDVEGSELEVLNALAQVIKRDRPFIICEVLPVYSADNVFRLTRQNKLESLVKSLRYKKVLINSLGELKEIDMIGIHADIARVNYLFFPEEKKGEMEGKVNLY